MAEWYINILYWWVHTLLSFCSESQYECVITNKHGSNLALKKFQIGNAGYTLVFLGNRGPEFLCCLATFQVYPCPGTAPTFNDWIVAMVGLNPVRAVSGPKGG